MRLRSLLAVAFVISAQSITIKAQADEATFNWTGFYLGVHAGRGLGTMDPLLEDPPVGPPTQHIDGWFGGLQAGYDWQMPNKLVFGAVIDVSFAEMSDRQPDGNFIKQYSEIDVFGTARLKLGYAADRFQPYLTGGLAWANQKYGETCPPGAQFGFCRPAAAGPYDNSDSHLNFGWVWGGGIKAAMTRNWVLGAEFLHFEMRDKTFDLGFSSTGRKVSDKPIETRYDALRITLDYKF